MSNTPPAPPRTPLPAPPSRPSRVRVFDELHRLRTLDAGPEAFGVLLPEPPSGPCPLLLLFGLGPDPAGLCATLPPFARIRWVECPAFESQMPPTWRNAVPDHWERLSPEEALGEISAALCGAPVSLVIRHYRAGTRLFPSFWGPLLAAVFKMSEIQNIPECSKTSPTPETPRIFPRPDAAQPPVVLLPGSASGLLTHELVTAFAAEGFTPVQLPDDDLPALRRLLNEVRPRLFFSVNFRGLDADGLAFHLLQAHAVPVAAWLVDNPWHLLSRFRQPWWRQTRLFCTDEWFLPGLKAHGAACMEHLPLACWAMPISPIPQTATSPPATPLTFVGRSAFPDKAAFFSGCRVPESLWVEAQALLDSASSVLPHLGWWLERLALKSLWPGNAVRTAGFGAERASLIRRTAWLRSAAAAGLTVYGDAGWSELLPPSVELRLPVDYYCGLGHIYAASRYSLNVTSLQLPSGLTQRHFDVWQAGGFLLSDDTPGLRLFPDELTELVRVPAPAALPVCIDRLERDSALRTDLCAAWIAHLTARHTYAHRVRTVLDSLRT